MVLVGKDFKHHLIPIPLPWAGTLDQVAQSLTQPHLEHFQGWGTHNFFGKPVPVPQRPQSREFLPSIESKPSLSHFEVISSLSCHYMPL